MLIADAANGDDGEQQRNQAEIPPGLHKRSASPIFHLRHARLVVIGIQPPQAE